ncbi:glycosyltransferase involved in cell wall biosynthesis [Scopulibacillus darangshiensis]|uniref:Glycosyltransferase involved in cell wall biosynthesis n=1 Tax=Scopulibacillus darangshiensis TaxID=442528 RepID=A0A4R2P585_9BACL|nr:glycosyltransferase [Scopulibacillus darangshiensis]TCP29999.1 glycosyltransferase involved in cell wall biosynthesis [Scopulibacillus darangshiensis]
MKKKICMFVWNHFTNDARVLRECTALSKEGYLVDLIAIHDRKNPSLSRFENRKEGFTVTRVKNEFPLMQNAIRIVKRFKIPAILLLIVLLGLAVWQLPLWAAFFLMICLPIVGAAAMKVNLPRLIVRFFIFSQMVRAGMKENYDLYHANDLNTLPQGWLCAKVLRIRKKKLIYDSHEVQTSRTGYENHIYAKMEKFFITFMDVMIMENHTRASYIQDLYGFYPRVVHNYPVPVKPEMSDSIDLHQLLGINADEPILLYQGGIQTGRGLDKLIEAVPQFKRGIVVFIGEGRIKPDLVNMVSELRLEDKVKFLPKVPVEELLNYTRNAYLGFQVLNNVCFNHYSASSNKLFEYMMSGVPVVACQFPEIQRVVETEEIGICIDSHDPNAIAEGVNTLLEDSERYAAMKANCFKARDKYNWEKEKTGFIDIYQKLG